MPSQKQLDRIRKMIEPYCITDGKGFKLKHFDPGDTGDFTKGDKEIFKEALDEGVKILRELQEKLYADDRWSVLLIFQAMDAAGKDGAIKYVFSGINPQGCQVFSFKAPSQEELDHDFLWRCTKNLPERGRFGIFNRSYYEEVLVVKVHPEFLAGQRLPKTGNNIFEKRYTDINNFEKYLHRNGTIVRKFFLHVSKKEQKKRFLERLDNPDKNWKFSLNDVKERQYWDQYMEAYEEMIRNTSTENAPWFVVPADNKWYARTVVAGAVIDALASLDLEYPILDKKKLADLDTARQALLNE
ncbi:MAG: polyphosphate kinase 2 family protein [Bacteroidales bacterium]|jgi:PPK2 family polyphosphate:nucleotide phosphotransferase|nr:polyphosphate kinase 2 family protein [Bacteroidales bacterium]